MAIVTSQLLRIMTELGFNVSTHTHTNNHTICLGLLRPTQSWNLPWLSKTISQLVKKRNYYFKKAHRSGSSVDYSKFKQLRNKVITELRLAKRRFFSNHNPQNPKEFWKIIRSLSPRESSSHLWKVKISLLVLVWTRPIFWTSPSVQHYNRSVPELSIPDLPEVVPTDCPDDFLCSEDEVYELLCTLDTTKSSGDDDISA